MRALLLIALLLLARPAPAQQQALRDPFADVGHTFDELYAQAVAQVRRRDYAAARGTLREALALRPAAREAAELALLLGVSCYRLGVLRCAEPALRKAAADAELGAQARAFLALVYEELGAVDQARRELELAQLAGRGARAPDLLLRPRRLTLNLGLATEIDGNVPLTDTATWARGDLDGDLVFSLGATLRPLPRRGLLLQANLVYRQQLRLLDYSLLLSSLGVGYSYLGDRHRLRLGAFGGYALLGRLSLYGEGGGRGSYRLRLTTRLGLGLGYEGRYRGYLDRSAVAEDFSPFNGHSHDGYAELFFGGLALQYHVLRDQLQASAGAADFRATAHGPQLRLRAQLHPRLELYAQAALLQRLFDANGREDLSLSGDLALYLQCARWLDAYLGAQLSYNRSSSSDFTYLKPVGYAGLATSFGFF